MCHVWISISKAYFNDFPYFFPIILIQSGFGILFFLFTRQMHAIKLTSTLSSFMTQNQSMAYLLWWKCMFVLDSTAKKEPIKCHTFETSDEKSCNFSGRSSFAPLNCQWFKLTNQSKRLLTKFIDADFCTFRYFNQCWNGVTLLFKVAMRSRVQWKGFHVKKTLCETVHNLKR